MKKCNLLCVALLTLSVIFSFTPAFAVEKQVKDKMKVEQQITGVIDINSAGVDDLVQLPGVGQKTAERIFSYRQENGQFKNIEDLMNVKGIGQKKFDKLKSRVTAS